MVCYLKDLDNKTSERYIWSASFALTTEMQESLLLTRSSHTVRNTFRLADYDVLEELYSSPA